MTDADARSALEQAFDSVGIREGDVLYLGVDMGGIPLPSYDAPLTRQGIRDREQRWCTFVLDALLDRVGAAGTVLIPTFTYAYARHGVPYHHESSPAETGAFAEFVRTRPGAVRAFHPLNSLAGVGARAGDVLQAVGRAGYGARSAFARLREAGATIVGLGTPLRNALTHAHHLEHMYGVNHMFHKVYHAAAYREGVEVAGPWLCFVRYLDIGVRPALGKLESALEERGCVREHVWSPGRAVRSVAVADVERVGYELLSADPCAFLDDPIEVHVAASGAAPPPSPRPSAVLGFR
jgi:aminoglycoside 3-N-acetyltransferase